MAYYGTIEGADAYLSGSGRGEWLTATEADRRAALTRASYALDALYGGRYLGFPADPLAQELAWPRSGIRFPSGPVPNDTVPLAIQRATYEIAYEELESPGIGAESAAPVKSETVGPISTTYAISDNGVPAPAFPIVEGILGAFLFPMDPQPSRFMPTVV